MFSHRQHLSFALAVMALLLAFGSFAEACPNCKDTLEGDPAHQGLAKGIYFSILFMLSMPFLLFGSLCTYFYVLVQREKKRLAAAGQVAVATARPTRPGRTAPGSFGRSPSPSA